MNVQTSTFPVVMRRGASSAWCFVLLLAGTCAAAVAVGQAAGSIAVSKHAGTIKHAVFVDGPDEMSPGSNVHRLYLSTADVSAAIKACKTLSCADAAVGEGMSVDYGEGSHLAYWVGLEGGRVQYSGGTAKDAFAMKTVSGSRLAGSLHIDDSAADGAKIDAEFDAALIATFASAR